MGTAGVPTIASPNSQDSPFVQGLIGRKVVDQVQPNGEDWKRVNHWTLKLKITDLELPINFNHHGFHFNLRLKVLMDLGF